MGLYRNARRRRRRAAALVGERRYEKMGYRYRYRVSYVEALCPQYRTFRRKSKSDEIAFRRKRNGRNQIVPPYRQKPRNHRRRARRFRAVRIRTSRSRRNLSLAVFYYKTDGVDKYVSIAIKQLVFSVNHAIMNMIY